VSDLIERLGRRAELFNQEVNMSTGSHQLLAATVRDECWEAVATIAKLRDALRPFVFGSAALEQVLFDGLPDDASGTITAKLGDFRRARLALKDIADE
jgi:hypothetical protein